MFQRTTKFFRQVTGNSVAEDRRVHERFPTDVPTLIRIVPNGPAIPARIRDVSRSGLAVEVAQDISIGSMISIDLPPESTRFLASMLACVMHIRPGSEEDWILGCRLSTELSEPEMRLFGGRKVSSDPEDQRSWIRFPTQASATYYLLPEDGGDIFVGDVVNISPTGIGMIVENPLTPGTVISVDLARPGYNAVSILSCVVYMTQREDGRWAVGCNFIRELTHQELNDLI
jgi:hypothetical protein